MKRLLTATILVLVCVIALCGCSAGEDERTYRDAADGRYGDALSLSGELAEDGKIVREVVFDDRLEGWHYLGVTARAGETLTFELSEEYAEYGLTAAVGRGGEEERTTLVGESCEWTPSVSGQVEVFLGDCIGRDAGGLTVSGGYPSSYYRAGVDRTSTVSADAIIDGTTARIYLCGNGTDGYDAAATARWWRSAAQMIFEFFDVDFGVGEGVPIDIFVTGGELRADAEEGAVFVPASMAADVFDYDRLTSGSAWSVLCKVVELVAGGEVSPEAERWMTTVVYVLMTDNAATGGGSPEGIGGGATCLEATIAGVEPDLAADYAFADLLHSFGADKAVRFISAYESGENFADAFYAAALEVYGLDVANFLTLFGLEVSDEVRDADAAEYVPVQSSYTLGANAFNATGTVVKAGESTAFDFASSIVTTAADYMVEVRSDHPERWSERDGIWYYTPAAGEVEDVFELVVTADGEEHALEGKLTYDITVGNVAVYENVPYREIDEAVDGYEDAAPTYVRATDTAGVPEAQIEGDESVYVLSVGTGSIQVDKTAEYEIHLRSRGVVRVDFGVPEYTFTMFRNSLTIDEYFGELYYVLELQEGVVYDYEVYALSTKGGGFASLGIREAGSTDAVTDIGKDMLIYDGYDRADVDGYEALDVKPRGFDIQPAERVAFDNSVIVAVDAPEGETEDTIALTDGDRHTVYQVASAAAEQRYALTLNGTRFDWFGFDCTVGGLGYRVLVGESAQDAQEAASGTTRAGANYVDLGASSAAYVALELTADAPFGDCVADLSVGTTMPECEVVPSEASGVFYQGGWDALGGVIGVNGTVLRSYGRDAAVEYSFRGEYIAVYCAKGPDYGNMLVYLDGVLQTNVDLFSERDEYGCLVWSRHFGAGGEHTLRLVADTSEDAINLDHFGVIFTDAEQAPPEYGNLTYLIIIPAVLLVVLIVCLCLDANDRRKRRMRTSSASKSDKPSDDKS